MKFLTMMMFGLMGSSAFGQITLGSGSNLQVNTVSSTTSSSQNLVSNGDFSKCNCQASRCAFNDNSMVDGWSADNQLEVGYGYLYNDYLGYERVIAPSKNTCVKQQLSYLTPGYYQVVVEYSARKDQQLSNCQFGVTLNGNLLKTIAPIDYQVRTQTIDVQVSNGCQPDLRICGAGVNDYSYGALIRSVRLVCNQNGGLQVNYKPIVIDIPVISPPTINIQTPNIYVPSAPTINVQTPTINLPTIQTPTINVSTPTINVPTLQPPTINVSTPTIYYPSAPTINVQTPTINIPTIQPPTITIPEIHPNYVNLPSPIINVPVTNRPPGIYIDSNSNQCYQKQYQTHGGDLHFSFDFKTLSTFQLSQSALFVTIDNQQVYKVLACDTGKTIQFVVPKIPGGQHVIGLSPYGCPNEPSFTFFVSNFIVQQKQCVAQWSSDLIVNGGFENQACQGSYCIWNQNNFQASFLPGWLPNTEIELGAGTVYNSKLVNTKVIELDANANTCIKQKLSLKAGTYNLNFDWAAREGASLSSNGIQATINGQAIKSVTASDYNVHTESVQFTLNSDNASAQLQFCGTGKSDSYGALLDNVKLFYYDQCGSYKINDC